MNEKSNRYGRHSSAFFGFTHIAPVAYLAGSKAREPSDKLAPFDAETVDVGVLSWEKYEAQIARGVSLQDARASLTQNAATQININTTFRDAFSFLSQRLFHAAQHEIRFIGIDGWLPDTGFTGRDMMRSDVVNAVLEKGNEAIVLTDSSKFGAVHPYTLGVGSRFNRVITDTGIPADAQRQLQESGLIVDIVNTTTLL